MDDLLAASARVALAAMWQDVGLLCQRATGASALPDDLNALLPVSATAPLDDLAAKAVAAARRLAVPQTSAPAPASAAADARLAPIFAEALNAGGQGHGARPACYPLAPLSAKSIFPGEQEPPSAYRALWDGFVADLRLIPAVTRADLPRWLDHFDSLWLTYAQNAPSAVSAGAAPIISLYDHGKCAAALATALWQWHHEQGAPFPAGDAPDTVKKLLFIQADLSGIQSFIFAQGSQTQKKSAKVLRGRSFFVSLFTECAALKVLEALQLPSTSQILNAAGKFMIIAPNVAGALQKLAAVQKEIDEWFLGRLYGVSTVTLAWDEVAPAELSDFPQTNKRLWEKLDAARSQVFGLCSPAAPAPVFADFHKGFQTGEQKVCEICGRAPAVTTEEGVHVCGLCNAIIRAGAQLPRKGWLLLGRPLPPRCGGNPLFAHGDLLGYQLAFAEDAPTADDFVRVWDLSLPGALDETLFQGYARRYVNAYVPRFPAPLPDAAELAKRYGQELAKDAAPGQIKTFEHLACEASDTTGDAPQGVAALMTLKGDVDNLGALFQSRVASSSFAAMAGLSRRLNAFFAVWLPAYCAAHPETAGDLYTVFAGGDDFFLIGPWGQMIGFAETLKANFDRYVVNPDIHFSAGMAMTHPGEPVRLMGELAEEALEKAKRHPAGAAAPTKNAITCFGRTVSFARFAALRTEVAKLENLRQRHVSAGFIYGLTALCEKAESAKTCPQDALWRSWFCYRAKRQVDSLPEEQCPKSQRQALYDAIVAAPGAAIEQYAADYQIALFTYLYRNRVEKGED